MTTPQTLRDLRDAASKGPWFVSVPPWQDVPWYVYSGSEDPHVGEIVADCEPSLRPAEDAAYIVALVNAAPGLLDRLESAERALRHIERALEQDPTIEEIREYGLDGATNPTGYLFNNLQWRLDLIRAVLSQPPQPHSAEGGPNE